ncbi:MAG: hypothetical protein CL946_08895 [Ectothiorhodospiraceae bacterium]|nr:hypothetical protein [Ectothiorhodospiraceae bacterium]
MDGDQIAQIKNELKEQGYTIYVYSYPPAMYFPEHKHEYPKLHVVLSGSLKITLPDREVILNEGERIEIDADIPHTAEVLGETPLICVDAAKRPK